MYLNNLNFFYRTGMFIGGIRNMDSELNKFNLVFFLGKKKSFFIINYKRFVYNIRICLFFLYRLISLRGKVLGYDDRFYIRRCLVFFFKRANQNYIIKHWIGGTLTNFKKFRIFFFQILKGYISIKKYYDLFLYYYGLKTMNQIPSLIIFTNLDNESVALQESFRLAIPIVSLIDIVTKNIFGITFPIPCNLTTKKTLIIFYSIIGDTFLYGLLKPVSYFFNMFLKRLKNIRKLSLSFKILKQRIYTNIVSYLKLKLNKNFKLSNFFLINNFFYYFRKKKIFNLKFFFNYKKKKFTKEFFKTSFFILWSFKKLLKIKKRKKKRRNIYKKIFKYKKRQKRYKFFTVFKILKKRLNKVLKKTYLYHFKKYLKKYSYLNYMILYYRYKNQYKKKQINLIVEQAKNEQEDIEEIFEKFNDLPEDRKIKKLKKLNENFEKLKIIYLKKDLSIINKFIKINFIKKFNLVKILKFKLKNKGFFLLKKLKISNSKNYFLIDKLINNDLFVNFKNNNSFNNRQQKLDFFFKKKKKYLFLLKNRRENNNFYINYNKDNKIISKINILYSRIQND